MGSYPLGQSFPLGKCNACGKSLLRSNARVVDGCPCNSGRGVNDPAIEAIEAALDDISFSREERARVGRVLDRVRSGEIGPTCDANSDAMRDYREQAFAGLAAQLRDDARTAPAATESEGADKAEP